MRNETEKYSGPPYNNFEVTPTQNGQTEDETLSPENLKRVLHWTGKGNDENNDKKLMVRVECTRL